MRLYWLVAAWGEFVMIRLICLLALLAVTAHAAAPANDLFSKAKLLTEPAGVLVAENNSGAGAEFAEPMIGGAPAQHSLWYRIIAARGGHLVISAADNLGLRMSLFHGWGENGFEALSPAVATSNSTPGDVEKLSIDVYTGQTLWLAVDSQTAGTFSLNYHIGGRPNDFFADATNLLGGSGSSYGVTADATLEEGEPETDDSHTVWYKWQATTGGAVTFDTVGSDSSTRLAAFSGTNLSTLTPLAENAGGTGLPNGASRVTFNANAGETYFVRVSRGFGVAGSFYLNYYPASSKGQFNIVFPADSSVGEGGRATVLIWREKGSSGAASVQISTGPVPGGATAGSDYQALNQIVNFADGQVEQTVTLTTFADNTVENSEALSLALSGPTNGVTLGVDASVFLSIDDQPATARLRLAQPVTVAREGEHVTVEVVRQGNPALPLEGTLRLQGTSATVQEGIDYPSTVSTVRFDPWEMSRFVDIYLPDDTEVEGPEDVQLQIDSSTATLRILDNDVVSPEAVSYEAARANSAVLGGYFFRATLTPSGSMTGLIRTRTATIPFKGVLSPGGELIANGQRPGGLGTMQVRIQCQDGMRSVSVYLRSSLGDVNEQFEAARLFSFTKAAPSPQAGKSTMYTGGITINGGVVFASFTGTLSISPTGLVKGVGRLVDGQLVSFGSQQDINSGFHAFVPLNKGLELLTIDAGYYPTTGPWDFLGTIVWQKLPVQGDKLFSAGFPSASTNIFVHRYTPPAAGHRALSIWDTSNGAATFNADGTGLGFTPPTVAMTISPTNAVTFPSGVPVKLKLNAKAGTFTGSFTPAGHAPVPFSGVLYQGPDVSSLGIASFVADGIPGRIQLGAP